MKYLGKIWHEPKKTLEGGTFVIIPVTMWKATHLGFSWVGN